MQEVIKSMRSNASGLLAKNARWRNQAEQIVNYYEFYDGTPDDFKDVDGSVDYGQLWRVPDNLDYKPTREIRNHTKKLIDKQSRFMFSVPPTIVLKPLDKTQEDSADIKKAVIERLFEETNFWSITKKAFLDCTIGKKVLLAALINRGEPIRFRYYNATEFSYTVNPHNCEELESVTICYKDDCSKGISPTDERWHRWLYRMQNGSCYCTYDIVNGQGEVVVMEVPILDEQGNETGQVEEIDCHEEFNTGFPEIPCRVIVNGGITGDRDGTSDVKELIDLANSYNHTLSDYRDALRFKMFEQPVFIDADSDALTNIKIAPNAIIDLKTDPTLGDGTGSGRSAQATTLSSSFNFQSPADAFLDRLKRDMYELMDQPLPEQIMAAPSGKALGYMFFDLRGRCEDKWSEWEPAIKWVIHIIEIASMSMDIYPEMNARTHLATITITTLEHNYPIPQDVEDTKGIAIQEVANNVLSHKSYIRKYGDSDEDKEWEEIMAEQDELNSSSNAGIMETTFGDEGEGMGTGLEDPNLEETGEGEEGNGGMENGEEE